MAITQHIVFYAELNSSNRQRKQKKPNPKPRDSWVLTWYVNSRHIFLALAQCASLTYLWIALTPEALRLHILGFLQAKTTSKRVLQFHDPEEREHLSGQKDCRTFSLNLLTVVCT